MLELRGVVKRYGETPVLRGVDLTVDEHQVVTLIGASGSGKSTLLRCVEPAREIDDGQILLDGIDISDPRADAAAAQRRMAIVFQAFNLFPHMTVLENVTLAPRVVHGVARRGGRRARPRAAAPGRARRVRAAPTPTGCPAASSSGWRSPARWPCSRGCCCSTRSPRRWTPSWSARCWRSCASWRAGASTILMATHEMGFARQVADPSSSSTAGACCESGPPEQVLGDPTEDRTRQFLARVIAAGRLN